MKRMNPEVQRFWEGNERRLNKEASPLEWLAWGVRYLVVGVGVLLLVWASSR